MLYFEETEIPEIMLLNFLDTFHKISSVHINPQSKSPVLNGTAYHEQNNLRYNVLRTSVTQLNKPDRVTGAVLCHRTRDTRIGDMTVMQRPFHQVCCVGSF